MIRSVLSHDFVDNDMEYYYLWVPSKLEEFSISVEQKEQILSHQYHVKVREAKLKETNETFIFYYVEAKELKRWKSRFAIWNTIYHPNHVGMHHTFKDGNNNIFVQDHKTVALLDLLKCYSKKTEFNHLFLPQRLKSSHADFLKRYNEYFVKTVAFSIFSFLSYLHKQGIVYGNITFENIVVTPSKTFALTSSLSSYFYHFIFLFLFLFFSDTRSSTSTLLPMAAPEVLLGEYHLNSDCWNVGILLYMMLVGSFPFSTDSEESLKNDINNKKLNFPNNSVVLLSKNSRDLITRLLHKDPTKRFHFFFKLVFFVIIFFNYFFFFFLLFFCYHIYF